MTTSPKSSDPKTLEARRMVGAIVDVLVEHGLLSLGDEELNKARNLTSAAAVFEKWLPERLFWFDMEYIWGADDYAELTEKIAQITGGEWEPENLTSALPETDGKLATISFEHRGQAFTWEVAQYGDWVSVDYIGYLGIFAKEHLTGQFVSIPTGDQTYKLVYLPQRTAKEVSDILRRMRT